MSVVNQKTKPQDLNDVSQWGEKNMAGAYPPGTSFSINGDKVPVDQLPSVSSTDPAPKKQKKVKAPVVSAPSVLDSALDAAQPSIPSGGA
jgi:hypothetical protein